MILAESQRTRVQHHSSINNNINSGDMARLVYWHCHAAGTSCAAQRTATTLTAAGDDADGRVAGYSSQCWTVNCQRYYSTYTHAHTHIYIYTQIH